MQINYMIHDVSYCEQFQQFYRGVFFGPILKSLIRVELEYFHFAKNIPCHVNNGNPNNVNMFASGEQNMKLYLDQIRFLQFSGREWDGTKEGVKEHKDLEGEIYTLSLKID